MEVGDTTESRDPALFEKMPIYWDSAVIRPEFRSFYTKMIALRKSHLALSQGKLKWLRNSSEERILTYLKMTYDETLFIAINLSNQPFHGRVELQGSFEEFEDLTPRNGSARLCLSSESMLSLGAWEFCIYQVNP